jgi:mRNA interferase MazF
MSSLPPSRGDVWDTRFEPTEGREQGGTRPAVILSHNSINRGPSEMVVVVPMTTRHRPQLDAIRTEVRPPEAGLSEVSYVIPDQIRAVSTRRLISRRGRVNDKTLAEVADRVRVVLDL